MQTSRSQLVHHLFVAARRDHEHCRHAAQRSRLLAHALSRLYAIQPGHQPVQQHQLVGIARRSGLCQLCQALLTARACIGTHAKVLQHAGQHRARTGVVVNDQHPPGFKVVRMPDDLRHIIADRQGHTQLEAAAFPHQRTDLDAPAHQLGQLVANGQTQAAAPKPPGDRPVHLCERREQGGQPVSRNAHARVGHAEHQRHLAFGLSRCVRCRLQGRCKPHV